MYIKYIILYTTCGTLVRGLLARVQVPRACACARVYARVLVPPNIHIYIHTGTLDR